MVHRLRRGWQVLRNQTRLALVGGLAVALAGCSGGMDFGELFSDAGQPPAEAQTAPEKPPAGGETGARVALLLPLGAGGETGRVARAMKQAAELAMVDAGNPGITLVVKDTRGTPAGARMAAQAAIGEGARLILGPLLAQSVQAVAPEARAAGIPVIAFSSLSSVAGQGVYLMSFLPEEEVDNVIRYAARTGKKRIAAMIPSSSYGTIVSRALRASAKRHGVSIVAEERYVRTPTGIAAPAERMARRIADAGNRIQALFFPEGPKLIKAAGPAMAKAGVSSRSMQLLGTGLWDTPGIRTTPLAIGGWYAGVEPRLVNYFRDHYQRTYGKAPPRIASLAYDATSLAIALGRGDGQGTFSERQITNPEGYQGMNGLFRFRPNGLIQRGLAILRVTPTGPEVVAPPPARFDSGY
jgi:ABC-type branched-subunit amino acid transport system substrate-binding protein